MNYNLTPGISLNDRTIYLSIPANTTISTFKKIVETDNANNYIAEDLSSGVSRGYYHYVNEDNQEVFGIFYNSTDTNLQSIKLPEDFGTIIKIDDTSVLYEYISRISHEKVYVISEDFAKSESMGKDDIRGYIEEKVRGYGVPVNSVICFDGTEENIPAGYEIDLDVDKITPEMFGAKGDGIHDDTNSLQSAITYAQGKTLYLGNKTYLIGETLSLEDVTLIGKNATIKGKENLTNNYMAIPHGKVEISGITFNANDSALGCLGPSADNLHINIDKCTFTGARKNITEELFALNSSIYLCAKEINLTNSQIIDNKSHGARLNTKFQHTIVNIDNCVFSYNGIHGEIVALGLAQYGSEEGTYYDKVTIQNCIAEHNGNSGISPHSVNNIIISNCVSNENGEHGFCLMNGKNGEISSCIAKNNRRYGIRLQGDYTSVSSYTGYKNFNIHDNYLIGSGIDIDNIIENGTINNNIMEYALTNESETPKGIRIGRANHLDDIFSNINFINNKINGYDDSIISYVELFNNCNFRNYIDEVLIENYKHGSNYFLVNTLNNKKYGTSNNLNTNFDDFSNWVLGAGVTRQNNNTFNTSGSGNVVICYKTFEITEIPKYISTYLKFNNSERIDINTGIRFRNESGSLISGSTIGFMANTPNNEMARIFDLSNFSLPDTAKKFDVYIGVNNLEEITLNSCLIALSNEIPIFPNIK